MAASLTPVSWKTLVKIAESLGFEYRRTTGDHMMYVKSGCIRPLVIPKYNPINGEKSIRSFMKTAGLTRKKFLELKAQHE